MPSVGANAAFAAAGRLLGVRLDPYHVFNFFVEIDGILAGGFSECSGLQTETDVKPYEEGGLNDYTHQFRGRTKLTPLVLTHGITLIDSLWLWHQDVLQGKVQRKNGTIYLLDRSGLPVLWWNFKGAFPSKWSGPDLNAKSGEVAVEKIELVHQGLSRPAGAAAAAGLAAALASTL